MAGVVALAVGRARRRLPARRRAPRGPLARHAERGDDARPVEDGAPVGDRRRLRDVRLPPLQRRVHDAHLRRAARLLARRVEPHGVPPARGLRARGLAVQLHRDRRQPDELARADGERRALEARLDGDALRLLRDAALPGGGPPRRRHQPPAGLRCHDRRHRAREPRSRGDPLHRLDRRLQRHVADGGLGRGPLPQLPAHRRRDRRQGLHRRPPVRRPRRADRGDRARLVRVPGPEVLGRLARVRAVEPVAGAASSARAGGCFDPHGRRRRLLELHGRGHRRRRVRDAAHVRSRRRAPMPTRRSSSAAAPTTRAASSSSRR